MRCITVSEIGLSNKDRAVASVAVNLVHLHGLKFEISKENGGEGDVAIINADSPEGRAYIESAPREQIKIVISEDYSLREGIKLLKPPVRIQDLADAMNASCRFMARKPAEDEQASPEKLTEPTDDSGNGTHWILHHLTTAVRSKAIMKLECPPYTPLLINGMNGSVATRASLAEIHIIARESGSSIRLSPISRDEFDRESAGAASYQAAAIVWHVNLAGSNGNLIPGHTLETQIKLSSIPRFPREYMRRHPEFMKMSTLLLTQAMSVNELQIRTRVHINQIIDFHNLVCCLGLANVMKEANSAKLYENMKIDKSGLFSKLARKLALAE